MSHDPREPREGGHRRGYQYGFSATAPGVFDRPGRERKAETMLRVLHDHLGARLAGCRLLDVGASTGIIDRYLAAHVAELFGVDIDAPALAHAARENRAGNLRYLHGDALRLPFADGSVDIVVCAHVYEHVPDAFAMMAEIRRVLRSGGVCYFAAGNRFQPVEPHYRVPLLSALPRPLAHRLIRRLGIAERYHELHYGLRGLRRLAAGFMCHDYTLRLIREPQRFATGYLLPRRAFARRLVQVVAGALYPVIPTYVWLLEKR